MSRYYEHYGGYQQPGFVLNKKLFQYKENKPGKKNNQGQPAMMMFFITMIKGIRTNAQGQPYHSCFKGNIVNNVDAKQREAAEK
jgi:hypothetical protein